MGDAFSATGDDIERVVLGLFDGLNENEVDLPNVMEWTRFFSGDEFGPCKYRGGNETVVLPDHVVVSTIVRLVVEDVNFASGDTNDTSGVDFVAVV